MTIAVNVLYAKYIYIYIYIYIYPANISKHNPNCEKQVVLLMISNKEKGRWHYLAVKKLSPLLRGIISKHQGDFYCLNCFHSFATENKLESYKKTCKNKKISAVQICLLMTLKY